MSEVKLYRKNSLGIGTWRIWSAGNTLLYSHSTVEGGAEITHTDKVQLNNSGRNLEQQIDLEMRSRISRQLDKGYKHSRDEALQGSTNQLGLVNPMLAQPLTKVVIKQSYLVNAYVQRKYDGHRCLITRVGDDIIAYTRKGKLITTVPHILQTASKFLPDGMTLDGELYIHGQSLQSLSSLIKREQPSSAKLTYRWYDITDRTAVYHDRYNMMKFYAAKLGRHDPIDLSETIPVSTMGEVYRYFKQFRDEKYEGAMLRLSIAGYQDAIRALQLIKVKEREDCEVTVKSGRPSKDGWAILRVQMPNDGPEFDISAPGSVPEKTEVMRNIASYISRKLNIEYAMLTADGIPFHAVAIRWHEEI